MSSIQSEIDRPPVEEARFSFSNYLYDWVSTVDHKRLGLMYIVSALLFLSDRRLDGHCHPFAVGVSERPRCRPRYLQPPFHYAWHHYGVSGGHAFCRWAFQLPGAADDWRARYGVPKRLNAFGFWIFLFGGFLLYFSYIGGSGLSGAGSAPDVGWFAYAPLTSRAFSRGASTDYWILGILVAGIGSIASAINVIVTTISMRCPGMTLSRMPMFVWVMLIDSWLIIIALPPLSAAQIMLLIDRFLGGNFFNTQSGGSAVLWQHFFWIFGHPEVYILIFPAFAILSEVIPIFSRKPIFGSPAMVGAVAAIGFHQPGRLGTPHVRRRHDFVVEHLLHRFHHAGRHSHRHQNFNWTATMYGGKLRMQHAHAVLLRLSLSIPDCRLNRHHAGYWSL